MKLKDCVKPAGHYKPTFDLVDPRVHNVVKYDIDEIKEQMIESNGAKQRARDITCCNRVLRVMEKQHQLDRSLTHEGGGGLTPDQFPQQSLLSKMQRQSENFPGGRGRGNKSPSLSPTLEKNGNDNNNKHVDSISDPQFSKKETDERKKVDSSRVLFFKKNKNFAY